MGVSQIQNAVKIIKESSSVLIALPEKTTADAFGSALALDKTLVDIGKKSGVISKNNKDKFLFLRGIEKISHKLEQEQNFIISVNTKDTPIEKFRYANNEGSLDIFLTPKNGEIEPKDIKFRYGNFDYDLIITLDTLSLEYLGDIFSNNSSFFYTTTIINIDHHAENANFGNLNIVNIKANSVAEIIFELISELNKESINAEAATNLLAGLIEKTDSFKQATITPQAFRIASELMALGGKRDVIVKNLYQNKNINLLKILGRGLARLRQEKNNIYWTALNNDDLAKAESSITDIGEVFEELQQYAKTARAIALFLEKQNSILTYIKLSNTNNNLLNVFSKYSPKGTQDVISFVAQNIDLTTIRLEVLDALENILKN